MVRVYVLGWDLWRPFRVLVLRNRIVLHRSAVMLLASWSFVCGFAYSNHRREIVRYSPNAVAGCRLFANQSCRRKEMPVSTRPPCRAWLRGVSPPRFQDSWFSVPPNLCGRGDHWYFLSANLPYVRVSAMHGTLTNIPRQSCGILFCQIA